MKNAEWLLEQGIPFKNLLASVNPVNPSRYDIVNSENRDVLGIGCSSDKSSRTYAILDWLDRERPKDLITLDEKTYLKNVVSPFVRQGLEVVVTKYRSRENTECIIVTFSDANRSTSLIFPDFEEGTRYVGMERGCEYTLRELGL